MPDEQGEGSTPRAGAANATSDVDPIWRGLLESYAIRSRELAEEVAMLREHVLRSSAHQSPGFVEKWNRVKVRDAACGKAREEINRYLKSFE